VTPATWTGPVDLPPVGHAPLVGDVVEFDEPRGLGVIEYGPGRRLGFHCTAITDGTRQVAVGTVVAFIVSAAHLGRLEAHSVRPLPGVVRPGSTLASTGSPSTALPQVGAVPVGAVPPGSVPPGSLPSGAPPGEAGPERATPASGVPVVVPSAPSPPPSGSDGGTEPG
jgi:hypothetical protein